MKIKYLLALCITLFAISLFCENALEVRTTIPGVMVYIDNTYVGSTESIGELHLLWLENIRPGRRLLKCTHGNLEPYYESLVIPSSGLVRRDIQFGEGMYEFELSEESRTQRTGAVIIKSRPTDASVKLNDIKAQTDCRFSDIPSGNCVIEVSSPGRTPLRTSFQLPPDEIVTVVADFFDNTITSDVKYQINFTSEPRANLYINERYIGTTPISRNMKMGNYAVELKQDNYKTIVENININRNVDLSYKLIPLGNLRIDVKQQDARIFVNGKLEGNGSVELTVGEGDVEIKIESITDLDESFRVPVRKFQTTYTKVNLVSDRNAASNLVRLRNSKRTWKDYYTEVNPLERDAEYSSSKHFWGCVTWTVFSPLTILADLMIVIALALNPDEDKVYIMTDDGSVAYAKRNEWFCFTEMFFDKDVFTYYTESISDYQERLRKKAEEKAVENNLLVEEKTENLMRTINKGYIKYRIGDGEFVDIKPSILR